MDEDRQTAGAVPADATKTPNEIDRLLSEAEALSAEIADDTLDLVDDEVTSLRADDIVRVAIETDAPASRPDVETEHSASNAAISQTESSGVSRTDTIESSTQHDGALTSEPGPSVEAELEITEPSVNDPIRAVEQAQSQLSELNDLLHDPDAKTRPSPTDQGRTAGEPYASEQTSAEFSNDLTEAIKNDAPPSAFRDEMAAQRVHQLDASPVADAAGDAAPPELSPSEAGPETDRPTAAPRIALRKRISRMMQIAAASTKDGVILFLNAMLNVMTFFDLPVRKLSVRSKHTIGIVGLVTLFMGVLAWALPPLLRHNPFEKLDPGIAVPSTNNLATEQTE